MVDSRQVKFAQAVQALVLAVAVLVDVRWVAPALAVIMTAGVLGGPGWNLLAYFYRTLPIPPGEPEPAAPPRFSQGLGATFMWISTAGLYGAAAESTTWWILGWGPALAVAVLSAIAAATPF